MKFLSEDIYFFSLSSLQHHIDSCQHCHILFIMKFNSFVLTMYLYFLWYPVHQIQVSPGDVVELSGIFLPIPYVGFRAMRAGLVADTYLEAMSVTHFKKKYEE